MEAGTVHVWRAYLPGERSHLAFFANLLSPDEQARAERFIAGDDTVSFSLRRGILRCVLSRYMDASPQELRFEYTPLGKPWVCEKPDAPGLNFSVSHAKEWVLIALGRDRDIGIDVEHVRDDLDALSIARRFFSQEEFDLIDAAPERGKHRLFCELWVRKEGYVKAKGRGLSMPLDRFTVPLRSDAPVRLHPGEGPWLFSTIPVHPHYASALVTHPPATHICQYQWRTTEDVTERPPVMGDHDCGNAYPASDIQ
ncbi:MAG: 4'-phosphopantetheinyl transferase superfamily protein [Deltaproteobacteria bacterium]|nr:4'-phosphopantetheinyl transferase superfamily protein [Deltaproteobacteria bacterium]